MTETPEGGDRTSRELINELLARGVTQAEIAAQLDRSPSLVSQIYRGVSTSEAHQRPLTELLERGRVVYRTPRPRTRDGRLQRVRGRRGEDSHEPPPPPPPPRRGRFGTDTSVGPDGSRLHNVQSPRTEGVGREQARQALMGQLRGAARGQRRVTFVVTLDDGRQVELGRKGGYRASDALLGARREGDDPLGWLGQEAQAVYAEIDGKIVNVSTRVWGRQTSAEENARRLAARRA